MSWSTGNDFSTIDETKEHNLKSTKSMDIFEDIENNNNFNSDDKPQSTHLNTLNTHTKTSRFQVKSSKIALEDFTFDEQFMIDAIAEHYKNTKKHISVKKVVYNFLNYPRSFWACFYHVLTFCLCIITIVLSMVFNVEAFRSNSILLLSYVILESNVMIIFLIELILHVWCCDIKLRYKRYSRLTYLYTFYSLIDIFVIVTILLKIILLYGTTSNRLSNEIIMGLQIFQISRILHYERYNNTLKMMGAIIWRHRNELLSSYLIILYMIMTVSFLIYLFEYNADDTNLLSLPDSFYFTVVSFATIGYGDIYPQTLAGKILISISAILGIALVALPAGIIGSGFALQLAYEEKKKRIANRKLPAVLLIQNAWRRHSIITKSRSSKYYKKLYLLLATHSGSILHNKLNNPEYSFGHSPTRVSNTHIKRSNVKIECFNAADNSATLTIYTGSKQKPLLTYIKIPDHISNTKVYKRVFQFICEINLNIALRNFKSARQQDSTLDNIVNKIQRQNIDILHQLSVLKENFDKAFHKSQKIPIKNTSQHYSYGNYASHSGAKKKAGKVDSVVNLNTNINALDTRLARIEIVLKQLLESNQNLHGNI